jgi:23S rRNA (cytidine1920-2'-O)/16S rRNA (cytidine1409-2'-O)-methyltransferase
MLTLLQISEKNLRKKRIDETLVERGLARSRSEAKQFILEGLVIINEQVVQKPSILVSDNDVILLKEPRKYVSRGGFKLEFAINEFSIDPRDKTIIDIGSSTGGFTDCMLKLGASRVYAVDVGTGQLDFSLRNNPSVIVLENINARNLSTEIIAEKVDLITIDVSFISIIKILPAIKNLLKEDGVIISLIKPQFEGQRSFLRKGIVKDRELHKKILLNLVEKIADIGLAVNAVTHSPIKGGKGNIEFFFLISRNENFVNFEDVYKIVEETWETIGSKK